MISAGDFRNGITLEIDGNVYQIMEFQHVKPGKGAAFVRTKIKDVINGGVVERTFRPTEKFPAARIDRVDMQYLYADGDLYNFMDVNTYEQVALNTDLIGDALKFVKENEMCKICSYNGKVFSVEPPLFVELEITDTEPGFKGDMICLAMTRKPNSTISIIGSFPTTGSRCRRAAIRRIPAARRLFGEMNADSMGRMLR